MIFHVRTHNCKGGDTCATDFARGWEIWKPEYMNNCEYVFTSDKKRTLCEESRLFVCMLKFASNKPFSLSNSHAGLIPNYSAVCRREVGLRNGQKKVQSPKLFQHFVTNHLINLTGLHQKVFGLWLQKYINKLKSLILSLHFPAKVDRLSVRRSTSEAHAQFMHEHPNEALDWKRKKCVC